MSDTELSESDDDQHTVLTQDVLTKWTKKQLQDWLTKHKKRKSGNKPILIARILRCVNFGSDDSGSEDSSGSDSDAADIPTFDSISDWDILSTERCPPVREEDIVDYFLYAKNPVTGKPKKCKRQLKKSRKFSQDECFGKNYLSFLDFTHNKEGTSGIFVPCTPVCFSLHALLKDKCMCLQDE